MADSEAQQHVKRLVAKGSEALSRRDFQEAVAALEAALELDPGNADAQRYLKFARLGARRAAPAAPDASAAGTGSRETMPPGGFKVLKPRKRKPSSGENPKPLVRPRREDDE